jgi:hypothetical protein
MQMWTGSIWSRASWVLDLGHLATSILAISVVASWSLLIAELDHLWLLKKLKNYKVNQHKGRRRYFEPADITITYPKRQELPFTAYFRVSTCSYLVSDRRVQLILSAVCKFQ